MKREGNGGILTPSRVAAKNRFGSLRSRLPFLCAAAAEKGKVLERKRAEHKPSFLGLATEVG